MSSTAQYKTIHPVKYYRDYLNHNIRSDGRDLLKFRPTLINIDSITSSDGSSIVKIGNTTVVCGIKAELAQPKAIEPENGFIVQNIDLIPLCSPRFRPGPPSEEAQVLTQCLADIVVNSRLLDLKQLCIAKEKLVWVLFCDLVCLDNDGCVLDASLTALVAALKTLKLPKVNYETDTGIYKVDESIKNKIKVNSNPVATTFILFDDNIVIADPTAEEESLASSIITVAVSNSEICFVHKPGGNSVTAENLDVCLKNANLKEKSVNTLLKTVLSKK